MTDTTQSRVPAQLEVKTGFPHLPSGTQGEIIYQVLIPPQPIWIDAPSQTNDEKILSEKHALMVNDEISQPQRESALPDEVASKVTVRT